MSTPPGLRARPSLVLVTLDTTRADHLSPYGGVQVETPALQSLANEGVTFDEAYAVSPLTLVAHTSILTGRYPPEHGVRNNGTHRVGDEITTLAEVFREQGYETAAFVSAAVLERRYGLDQGFEVYDDDLSGGRDRHPRMVADRPAEVTVDAALGWLDRLPASDRFFVWLHLYDPHARYSPPAPFRDRYRERLYDGEIAYMDSQLARLLAHPRVADREGTLVSVLADHGESLGEHGEETHGILAYDATLRIPWILRAGQAPRGARAKVVVSQVDVFPTLLELAGVAAPRELPGLSIVPLLKGDRLPSDRLVYSESFLPFYSYRWAKLRIARRGSWKYIDAPAPELFDLAVDPRELTNQASAQPGTLHDLRRDLASGFGDEREHPIALDPDAAERLRLLGYVVDDVAPLAPATPPDRLPNPKDVIALHVGLERARELEALGLYPAAADQLRDVLAKDPRNLAAHLDLASVLALDRRFDEALGAVRSALAIQGDSPRAHLMLAAIEARRDRLADALTAVESALRLDPDSLEARLQEVRILARLGRGDRVQQRLHDLETLHPRHPRVDLLHAQLIDVTVGDLVAAEQRLRRALAVDPFLSAAWIALGQLQEQTGHPEHAQHTFEQGLVRAPSSADLHGALGLLLARAGSRDAGAHLEEAIRLTRDFSSELHVALGGWLAERGQYERAAQELEKVLAVDPANRAARNNRALAFIRAGRLADAERELLALAKEQPRFADARTNLAGIAVHREDWKAAEAYAREALALDPRAARAWNNLGVALDEQGRIDAAIDAYERGLALQTDYWEARYNLGVALRKAQRFGDAARSFEMVITHVPDHADSHAALAEIYAGPLHDPARARSHYKALLAAAPDHPAAAAARRRLVDLTSP